MKQNYQDLNNDLVNPSKVSNRINKPDKIKLKCFKQLFSYKKELWSITLYHAQNTDNTCMIKIKLGQKNESHLKF